MIDQILGTPTRLWTPEGFREDAWIHAESADALVGNSRVVLPLQVFLGLDRKQREHGPERLGVLLLPGEGLEKITGLLDQLALVALAFPSFSDGRSFSKSQQLRSRYRFEGSVRATGQILVDQLPHMLRVGFDEFEISDPVLIRRLEKGNAGGIPLYYQPAAKPASSATQFAWRRVRAV